MNKCINCPYKYIDFRGTQKCRLDSKVINAYGCERELTKLMEKAKNGKDKSAYNI